MATPATATATPCRGEAGNPRSYLEALSLLPHRCLVEFFYFFPMFLCPFFFFFFLLFLKHKESNVVPAAGDPGLGLMLLLTATQALSRKLADYWV